MEKKLDVILLRIIISESDVKIVSHEHKIPSQNYSKISTLNLMHAPVAQLDRATDF